VAFADGLVVDIDGVLTTSWEPIEGAAVALGELRRRGVALTFATNTTSLTRAEVAAALGRAGMEVDASEILTAPAATARYLRAEHPGARVLLINEGDLRDDLEGITLVPGPPADVVLIGGAGSAFTYDAMNTAFGQLVDGAALVSMHRSLAWRTEAGLQLDSGGFVHALEEAAGVEAVVMGKPSPSFFEASLTTLGLPAERVGMVGDDVRTDVLAAQACGMTGVLVRTGKFRPGSLEGLPARPDIVVDSFAAVPELFPPP
jgi:HAD superfamily hydrolase (TIGR01458 family)